MILRPFHLAIPVKDLASTREFYGNILGLKEGRSAKRWIDWDFFGHQIATHLASEKMFLMDSNYVDGHDIPARHFGLVMEWNQWHKFKEELIAKNIDFTIDPYVRFLGKIGEQATMFFKDFSGNELEFKTFKNEKKLFSK